MDDAQTGRQIKKELCAEFDLNHNQLSVKQPRGTGRWLHKYHIQTKDPQADMKLQ